jgi:hypothetical protein
VVYANIGNPSAGNAGSKYVSQYYDNEAQWMPEPAISTDRAAQQTIQQSQQRQQVVQKYGRNQTQLLRLPSWIAHERHCHLHKTDFQMHFQVLVTTSKLQVLHVHGRQIASRRSKIHVKVHSGHDHHTVAA